MNSLFAQLTLADVHQDVARNIVSLRQSQDLFDDLTTDPAEWLLAQRVEDEIKPPPYTSKMPIIDRPFEDAEWFNAIAWPFKNWQASRFSDGSFGVWYGSDSVETTVFESAYHWHRGLLCDAGFEGLEVIAERKVYWVECSAALLDFRGAAGTHPDLLHPLDYAPCQSVGARIHREGHPGLLTKSVRRPDGENLAIFNPAVLSNPRHNCQLTYRLDGRQIVVEKQPGVQWITVDVAGSPFRSAPLTLPRSKSFQQQRFAATFCSAPLTLPRSKSNSPVLIFAQGMRKAKGLFASTLQVALRCESNRAT